MSENDARREPGRLVWAVLVFVLGALAGGMINQGRCLGSSTSSETSL
jgi:hypothetical protein